MRFSILSLMTLGFVVLSSCNKRHECSCVVHIDGDIYQTDYEVNERDYTEAENKCFKIEKETNQNCELR
jgi:hypothetical protein